jgi:ribosomal protein S18 acetylase RimI-like enzyme
MIRPARPDDTPILKALTAGAGVFKVHEIDTLQEVLDDFHAGRCGANHCTIVEEDGGRIIGYAYYAPDIMTIIGYAYYAPDIMTDRSWYLYWIAVAKDVQARGVGGRLLDYAENDVRRKNGRIMFIETSSLPHSELTRKFYLKHGYSITGTLKDFYSDGDHMVVFRKRLDGIGD